MPDLLLELFSEEIPARMQRQAAENLKKLITDALVNGGLVYEGAKAFVTPRRLALSIHGLPAKQPDLKEEKKGPRVGAPDGAIQGFLKAAGLKSISEAKVQNDKKGDFYIAITEKKGRATQEVIAELVPQIVRSFPWPKSMRWGSGNLIWVRPLHSIVCTFGPETEDPEVVRFDIDGIKSGSTTLGHRVMSSGEITVKRLDDYAKKLEAARVVLDADRRKEIILADAKNIALAQGLELVEDEALLEEVAGLVEWPVVLLGEFEAAFLDIPPEVIRATIRANQKCFVLAYPPLDGEGRREAAGWGEPQKASAATPTRPPVAADLPPQGGGIRLANKFILVSNLEATDGGEAIKAGNARVIRARLSDAKFFWDTDRKTKLEARLPKFEQITFHELLGSQATRIERIERLASEAFADIVKANVGEVSLAAKLAKADLLTEVVGEFPEVQGLMGKYYALAQDIDPKIAVALEEHYKPQGPNDRVPTAPISVAIALADKIDTLVGFWSIGEKPTGSKDPYALRRAALGVIRIILENGLRVKLRTNIFARHFNLMKQSISNSQRKNIRDSEKRTGGNITISEPVYVENSPGVSPEEDLLAFFGDRLKVYLRDAGARHDLVDAVFALEGQDDLVLIVRRAEALGKFLDTEDGKNLLAGYKRAANILSIEEKKDKKNYSGEPDAGKLTAPEEKALAAAIKATEAEVAIALKKEDFEAAMRAMALLRRPVDAFFDKVIVNADDKILRENRLKLLNRIREATRHVADFSRIEG